MHGIKKNKNETEEEKQKAAASLSKKISKYQQLLLRLKEKKKNKEYDDEALKLTDALLSVNGECYTMWNYRRVTLLAKFEEEIHLDTAEASPKDIAAAKIVREKKLLERELTFTQQALMRNVKSYWCWNQRQWATGRLNALSSCRWNHEIALCNKLLNYDARNFHCWNYRRYVIKNSDTTNKEELEFTTSLIEENFSNYSAWHQRSKLLPLLFQERDEFLAAIGEELEIIKNAFYTMPADSSAWFYHRWLVNQNPIPEIVEQEIQGIEELLECLEDDNERKWPKLTLVFLFKLLNEEDPRIAENLTELVRIDPFRQRFYSSLSAVTLP